MAPHVNAELLLGWREQREAEINDTNGAKPLEKPCVASTPHQTFEGFPTNVARVRPALLVLAGSVADESALLSEALLAHVAAVGPLAGVSPVVFVQTRWGPVDELVRDTRTPTFHTPSKRIAACEPAVTLRAEGLAAEVTLEGPLAAVHAQVHGQVVLLGERVAAHAAHKRPLVPVQERRSAEEGKYSPSLVE